jgi:hypothetical protein
MYSPKIKDEFIPALYRLSKKAGLPMTTYVNQIIGAVLAKEVDDDANGIMPTRQEALPPQKTLR